MDDETYNDIDINESDVQYNCPEDDNVAEQLEDEAIDLPPIPIINNDEEISIDNDSVTSEMLEVEDNEINEDKNKKVLKYLFTKKKRAVLKRAFHIWQLKPHEVAPLSKAIHCCSSCGTEYEGNFCPRCGQSASIGRFSFKKAVLLFLDVWGMGNRSMFRSLRDLILRPGYMIRDYLSGMQSAYFPPFKMFFVLLTIMFVIDKGFSLDIDKDNSQPAQKNIEVVEQKKYSPETATIQKDTKQKVSTQSDTIQSRKKKVEDVKKSPVYRAVLRFDKTMSMLWEKNPAIFSFLMIMLFSWPLFFFLRRSPNIPDLRFSEFIVAMVYTSNSFTIFSMLGTLLYSDIKIISVIMVFVALSQFSGYKKRRIFLYLVISLIISSICLLLLAIGGIGLIKLFV